MIRIVMLIPSILDLHAYKYFIKLIIDYSLTEKIEVAKQITLKMLICSSI